MMYLRRRSIKAKDVFISLDYCYEDGQITVVQIDWDNFEHSFSSQLCSLKCVNSGTVGRYNL